MKDSGIEWIGEIPSAWETNRINSLYSERNIKVSDQDFEPLSVTKHGILPQLESAAKTDNGDNRKLVKSGDFVINSRSDRRGSCGISDRDGSVSLINIVLEPSSSVCNNYFNYVFRTERFADEFYRWGNGIVDDLWSTKWSSLKRINICVPPLLEQQAIADYLDYKCSLIDSTIEKQKAVIEKLKLYKQSIITEAVTKGLDPHVKMKPSGIEWIGDIPEGWIVSKLGTVASVQTGPFGSQLHNEDYVDEGTPIITVEHFGEGNINHTNLPRVCDVDLARLSKYTLKTNDLVFSRVGSVDRSVIVTEAEDGWLFSGRCLRVRFDSRIIAKFINYFFCQVSFKQHMGLAAVGSTMPSINTTILRNIRIAYPTIYEQQRIVDYLDKKSADIDHIIATKGQLLTKLEEYKKSLIYECVTGKREVV